MFSTCKPKILASVLFLSLGLLSRPAIAQVDLAGQWARRCTRTFPSGGRPGNRRLHRDAHQRRCAHAGRRLGRAASGRWSSTNASRTRRIMVRADRPKCESGRTWTRSRREWWPGTPSLRFMLPQRTIYMDGRPHPSEYAPHTWQGFSTGEWEGDMLKVTTTT